MLFAVALGMKAIQRGCRTLFVSVASIVATLTKAYAENHLEEKLKTFTIPKLLIINEIGFRLPMTLEDILAENINIASPNWLVIGRQSDTDYGMVIDLLALDRDANIVVIGPRRDKTPRDILNSQPGFGCMILSHWQPVSG